MNADQKPTLEEIFRAMTAYEEYWSCDKSSLRWHEEDQNTKDRWIKAIRKAHNIPFNRIILLMNEIKKIVPADVALSEQTIRALAERMDDLGAIIDFDKPCDK